MPDVYNYLINRYHILVREAGLRATLAANPVDKLGACRIIASRQIILQEQDHDD